MTPDHSALVGLLLSCALTPCAAASTVAAPQDPPPSPNGAGTAKRAIREPVGFIRGELRSRYYLQWTSDDTDNDLVSTLSIDVGDSEKHDYTAHLMGRLAWDIDGRDGTFSSINDSYGRPLDGLLYDAYVDLHRMDGFSTVRLGRQSIYETPETAYLDGVHVASEELGEVAFQTGGSVGALFR